jgi:hypothetical protein
VWLAHLQVGYPMAPQPAPLLRLQCRMLNPIHTLHQSTRYLKPEHVRLQRHQGMRQESPSLVVNTAIRLACCLRGINTRAPAVLRSTSACKAPDMDHSRRRASRPLPPDDHTRPSSAATAATVPSCAAASCPAPTPVHSRSYEAALTP